MPGNVSEPATLAAALERLGNQRKRQTVVMDAGVVPEANIAWLNERGYKWIVVARGRRPAVPEEEADASLHTSAGHTVKVWRSAGDGEMRLALHSDARELTERSIFDSKHEEFEQELAAMRSGLTKRRCMKRAAAINRRIGRLAAKPLSPACHYDIVVHTDAAGVNATDITWQAKDSLDVRERSAGVCRLRSNLTDWDDERIVRTYGMLTQVEDAFSTIKSELNLRPIHHQLERRVRSHLLIAVLAYQAVHALRFQLLQANVHHSWSTLRNMYSSVTRCTTTQINEHGQQVSVRVNSYITPEQRFLLAQLGLKHKLDTNWSIGEALQSIVP